MARGNCPGESYEEDASMDACLARNHEADVDTDADADADMDTDSDADTDTDADADGPEAAPVVPVSGSLRVVHKEGDAPYPAAPGPDVPNIYGSSVMAAGGRIKASPGDSFTLALDFELASGSVEGAFAVYDNVRGYFELYDVPVYPWGEGGSAELPLQVADDAEPGLYEIEFALAPLDADALDTTRASNYIVFDLIVE